MSDQQSRRRAISSNSQRTFTQSRYAGAMHSVAQQARPKLHRAKLVLVVMLFLALATHITWTKHVAAENLAAQRVAAAAAAEAKGKSDLFNDQVTSLLAESSDDTISVVAASNTTPLHNLGSSGSFDGASTGKLLTAADFLKHVEHHTASLQQVIDGTPASVWLQRMIVNSDNQAWYELNTYLTHQDLAAYAQSIGFINYDPDTNTFTALDMARLVQKLYDGSLLNAAHRSLLLNDMKQANYRQYIVAAVPSTDTVYHKIGFDGDTINDVAIITNGSKYVVLSIYTNGNGTYDHDQRTELIHEITKDAIAAYL